MGTDHDAAHDLAPPVDTALRCASLVAPPDGGETRIDLRLLKWLAIVLPLLFLALAEATRGLLFGARLDSVGSRVFFFGVVAAGVALFSQVVFTVIDRLERRILRQNEHLAAMNAIAMAAAESPGLEALLEVSLEQVLGALDAHAGLICVVDLEQGEHSAIASRGFSDELVQSLQHARLADDPIAAQVVETGCPVVLERLFDDPRVSEVARREGVRSAITTPLKSHRELAGIMAVASREERSFGPAEQAFLSSVASQLGMAMQHAAVFERSLQRNREMEALLTIGDAVTSSLDLPHVLDRALETILAVTSAEAAEVWLADGDELTLARHRGASPGLLRQPTRLRSGEGLPGAAFETGKPVLVHGVSGSESVRPRTPEDELETCCALPLLHKQTRLGVLAVAACAADALKGPDELRLLMGISEVLSVAIENARLYERVQDTAVLEERERIAREMHDGLAQVLAYVNAQSLAIGKLLASGRSAEARMELDRMEEAVREVYADVREAILGLRTSPRAQGGLLPSLRSYLDAYSEMTGMTAQLRVGERADSAYLPPSTEIQLTRIIQEALTNVRKHARARTATVTFECSGDELRVLVEDDGRGFDPGRLQRRGWPRFGLQTMRERADAIGGRFSVDSCAGGGTRVLIGLSIERTGVYLVAV